VSILFILSYLIEIAKCAFEGIAALALCVIAYCEVYHVIRSRRTRPPTGGLDVH